jgi:magnesium transporter
VDSFTPAISQVESEADILEDQVFIMRPNDNQEFLRRIGIARKNIMGLMRLLRGKADVLRGFTKRCNENYKVTPHMDIALYLGDIQDHVVAMTNSLIHFEKMLSRSHSNYLAQLSIDSITQGNQVNESLTRVTVLATVLVPLVVVSGLFGMNIKIPWQDDNNLNAWFGIVGGIVLFAITCLLVARRMRYI